MCFDNAFTTAAAVINRVGLLNAYVTYLILYSKDDKPCMYNKQ